jgi:hypothetical protein
MGVGRRQLLMRRLPDVPRAPIDATGDGRSDGRTKIRDIPMFRVNAAAFNYELLRDACTFVRGWSDDVHARVLTNASAPDQNRQQVACVSILTAVTAGTSGRPTPPERIWAPLTEARRGATVDGRGVVTKAEIARHTVDVCAPADALPPSASAATVLGVGYPDRRIQAVLDCATRPRGDAARQSLAPRRSRGV